MSVGAQRKYPKFCLTFLGMLFSAVGMAHSLECQPLTETTKANIEKYLSYRHNGPNDPDDLKAKPQIESIALIPNSCFWKIAVLLNKTNRPIIMYLSPDQRFLTSKLYDLTVDPQVEIAKISQEVDKFLLRDVSPKLNGPKSQVDLVEFSDLQCPYCKRFSEWYEVLPKDLRDQTTLVYKHFPLPQHPWARQASIYSACAATISNEMFWQVVHQVFEKQLEVTIDTLEGEVFKAVRPNEEAEMKAIKACVESGAGAAIVDRDLAAAKQLAVSGTPTLFVNGLRVTNIKSAKALEDLIRTAINKQQAHSQSGVEESERGIQ